MPVFETFSKRRRKRANQGKPMIYQQESLSGTFRAQVVHIWNDAIGAYFARDLGAFSMESPANPYWTQIYRTMMRELGAFQLGKEYGDPREQCIEYVLSADTEHSLDIIELSFRVIQNIDAHLLPDAKREAGIVQGASDAISELNARFLEHGIGYQYVGGNLIEVSSEYLHSEVVEPAVMLLHDLGFRGPEEEYLRAHEHYRKGRYKEAIIDASKSFESTIKTICIARGWQYDINAPAQKLVETVFQHGLVPSYLQTQFTSLRTLLETGVSVVRNKTSGHGQGPNPVDVPKHVAAYALHTAASNIVFLVEAHKALK